ncbi:MAG: Veg family protein [Raoultibacter sp.]
MDLAKQAKIVDSIHDTLDDFIGQRLRVRANMGRSKIVECEGVLTQVHPQLFIMEVDRKRGRTARQSYQYVDVLTGMVELSQGGEPLFDPFIEETPVEPVATDVEGEEGAEEGTETEAEAETEEVFA